MEGRGESCVVRSRRVQMPNSWERSAYLPSSLKHLICFLYFFSTISVGECMRLASATDIAFISSPTEKSISRVSFSPKTDGQLRRPEEWRRLLHGVYRERRRSSSAGILAQGQSVDSSDSPESSESADSLKSFAAAPAAHAVIDTARASAAVEMEALKNRAGNQRVAVLASPRGFCEGVRRAVHTVEEALRVYGAPVYVKHQIVHNEHVCRDLESRGAVFVDSLSEVPSGAVVVFSAHGVPPALREEAAFRGLRTVDATCPLVQKVHVYVQQKAREGYHIIIIGHKNHVEVQGVKGEAPDATSVVGSVKDVQALNLPPDKPLFYVTQTTLSLLDCQAIEKALRDKYPEIKTIPSGSVCYATTNRQAALGAISEHADLALVVGSTISSNAKRLVEIAKAKGIPAYLVAGPEDVDPAWLEGKSTVALSASASTPEIVTQAVAGRLKELGANCLSEVVALEERKPTWRLPRNLREAAHLKAAQMAASDE